MKTALVAGSTGLIGSALLKELLAGTRYGVVKALTRSTLDLKHPKLQVITVDFATLAEHAADLEADDVFCCLGTTMSKARTREKFRLVDYDYVVSLARVTRDAGASQYLLVSALGADKRSSIFYNRVKGEAEEAVMAFPFRSIHIMRPSLLLGPRGEKRPGEDVAKRLYRLFGWLIPGRYKAIEASAVAKAMLQLAALEEKGIFYHESKDIRQRR